MALAASATVAQGEHLPFSTLCKFVEAISTPAADRFGRPEKLRKLWEAYGKGTYPLFPLMRLLLPHLDTIRPNYRVKEKQLARMYIGMLALDPSNSDAQEILNWKRSSSDSHRKEQGNFPEVVYRVIKDRCLRRSQIKQPVTIGELNSMLDDFAKADGMVEKVRVLTVMHTRMTAQEQRWMLHIVIKDMKIGMKEASIFSQLHPDAQELYNSVCDLQATCIQCSDQSFRLSSIGLQLFKPVKPRLAARVNWQDVPKLVGKTGRFALPRLLTVSLYPF